MKKIITSLLFGALSTLFISAFAQENFTCGSHIKMAQVYQQYPELEREHEELLEASRSFSQNDRGDREEIYIIPIVFHIVHQYGAENISDAQVYDQVAILNRDFRKLNSDTTEIMTEFKPIAKDAKIEFRLASIDPFGNCTNGIEHIYSHETNQGNDPSKLNQWPRSRYLNIWVVKNMENGVAGYAYYPSAVSGGMYYADGIIIRHNYIGSIGTSDLYSSRALTHEIGHYLGLPHTWGNTNNPGVACGDDGIDDTPVTKGHTACVLTGTDVCNAGIPENIQNYMEYAYCSRMYTEDQVAVMNLVLNDLIASRNNLSTEENHINTGINVTAPLCSPVADFYGSKQLICVGGNVTFTSTSWRAPVDVFEWHFPGGTPEYSASAAPNVAYNTAGYFPVTLTVTNAAGTNTKTMDMGIAVQGDWWEYEGPHSESFESGSFAPHWIPLNTEDDESVFEVYENVGATGNFAAGVVYYKDNLDPILDLNYWERIGGSKEILITPVFNLDNTAGATLDFKIAHASISSGVFEGDDLTLKVYYSTNCGATWSILKNLKDDEVLTAGFVGSYFSPTNQAAWYQYSAPLPGAAMQEAVRFKFEFTAVDYSNNFFIDDVNVTGVLLNEENSFEITSAEVYPNPLDNASIMSVKFSLHEATDATILVQDMLGNLVLAQGVSGVQGENLAKISLEDYNLQAGIYTISITTESATKVVKIMVK